MEYSIRAVRLYKRLQECKDGAAWIVGKQYLRAATSIGANLLEAQAGESRRDFVHKCSIAQKEARESKYWLTLLRRASLATPDQLDDLIDETDQIIAILTTIIVNTKRATEY